LEGSEHEAPRIGGATGEAPDGRMVKSILVGVAGTPALPAKIAAALELAQRHDAAIDVISIVDIARLSQVGPVPIGAGPYAQRIRARRIAASHELDEGAIAAFEAAGAEAGAPVRAIRAEGAPLDVLTAHWRYHDLCILGARGWFDHKVMDDPEGALLSVVTAGVQPILAVTERAQPIRRALIAYNGSPESAKAMKRFLQMGLWPDVEARILCVGAPKSGETAHALLADAARYCRLYGVEPSMAEADGSPTDAILAEAERMNADLIVLGAGYRRALISARFGGNALRLVRQSPIPLFFAH